jgi:hypothetical protein
MSGIVPVNATVTVATAGTRVQINSTAGLLPTSIYFEALGSNSGNMFIGLSDVASTKYIARLTAGNGFSITSDGIGGTGRLSGIGLSLASFYADCSSSGDKVQVTYMYNQKT